MKAKRAAPGSLQPPCETKLVIDPARFRKVLERKGMTVAELGRRSGIFPSNIFRLLVDDPAARPSPPVDTIARFAKALGHETPAAAAAAFLAFHTEPS